jgi:hypothetical protein
MSETIIAQETQIDQLIYKIVADKNGATNLHEEIIDKIGEKLTPTKITRILRGSSAADIPLYELRLIYDVLKEYQPDISYEYFIGLFD